VAGTYRELARERFRADALDAAGEAVVAHGWRALQMREIAGRVGVSRQTLHNEFGSKHCLARALVMRLTAEFLDGVEGELTAAADPAGAWSAAVRYTLDTAADKPLMKSLFLAQSSDEFLPLLTVDGAPIVDAARDRIIAVLARRWPRWEAADLAVAAESVVRLTLSHIMLPLHPTEEVAEQTSRLAMGLLGPPDARPSTGTSG
jgi:AcrR family transcriptional regulator